MKNGKFILETVMWFVAFCSVLFGLWMMISFLEIVSKNIDSFRGYGNYASWNLFIVIPDVLGR